MATKTRAQKKVAPDGFEVYLSSVMKEFNSDTMTASREEAEKAASEAVKDLEARSPKSKGKSKHKRAYARTWGVTAVKESPTDFEYVVHNASNYQLTHLLEHGHVIANGTSRCRPGFVKGIPHIKPVADRKTEEYIQKVEDRIQKG